MFNRRGFIARAVAALVAPLLVKLGVAAEPRQCTEPVETDIIGCRWIITVKEPLPAQTEVHQFYNPFDDSTHFYYGGRIYTAEEMQTLNRQIFDDLQTQKQETIDAVNDYTRIKLREDSFFRRITPPDIRTLGSTPEHIAEWLLDKPKTVKITTLQSLKRTDPLLHALTKQRLQELSSDALSS